MNAQLVLPFVLPNGGSFADTVERACAEATQSCLISWDPDPGADPSSSSVHGVALGCADGSVFLFSAHSDAPPDPAPEPSPVIASTSRASSRSPRQKRTHRSHSRPGTPSASLSPLSVAPRSRIVAAGLSSEQAQAPKNYVDFDEEEGKLKHMLKSGGGGGVRDASVADRLLPSFAERRLSIERTERPALKFTSPSFAEGEGVGAFPTDATSLLSAVQSAATTPKSPSSPVFQASASAPQQTALRLSAHVCLNGSGKTGQRVTALHHLTDDRLLVMQANGSLSLLSEKDGTCASQLNLGRSVLHPPEHMKAVDHPAVCWDWKRLQVLAVGEKLYVFACAAFDPMTLPQLSVEQNDHDDLHCARFALLSLNRSPLLHAEGSDVIEVLGTWTLDAKMDAVELVSDAEDNLSFFYVDSADRLTHHYVHVLPVPLPTEGAIPTKSNNLDISVLNPFKSASSEKVNVIEPETVGNRVQFEAATELGALEGSNVDGLRIRCPAFGKYEGIFWCAGFPGRLYGFSGDGDAYSVTPPRDSEDLQDVRPVGANGTWALVYPDHVAHVQLVRLDYDGVETQGQQGNLSLQEITRVLAPDAQLITAVSDSTVLSTKANSKGRHKFELYDLSGSNRGARDPRAETVWKASSGGSSAPAGKKLVTYMLPLSLTQIIMGFDDGSVAFTSYSKISQTTTTDAYDKISDSNLDGAITGLHTIHDDRTGAELLVGGADDGSVAIWSLDSAKLLACWTIFTTPLKEVIQLPREKAAPLRGCILCISQDGTIAVIALDDYQFLFLIPGAQTPLSQICFKDDSLLLVYSNERGRLWDARTREFRRALTLDKAEEVLLEENWIQISLDSELPHASDGPHSLPTGSRDSAAAIVLDVQAVCARAVASSRKRDGAGQLENASEMDEVRTVLAVLLTPGLNAEVDSICSDKLHIPSTNVSVGHWSPYSTSLLSVRNAKEAWRVSGDVSAARALAIVSLLRTLSHAGQSEELSKVIGFYTSQLGHAVGPGYKSPSLAQLARWWFDRSTEVRGAARALFDIGINNLPLEETISLVDSWQHLLPCLQPDVDKKSPTASLALLLCGYLAAHKYILLSSSALGDVSKSIMMYLHDEDAGLKATAVDLSSRGFDIWQQYIDATAMLRLLVALATSTRKESITGNNIGPQARQAVLNIVTHHTGLFMATLSLDIMNPQDVEHRRSVMQLVAFLIRKRPLVIFPNLPRLVEAVVKSLDPNHNSNRETILDSATEILGHVVQTFPTVDFHMASQKLAVGTSEGAVVMYDLKTGTRLYVLDGHKMRPSSVSFSPDGRRLVTVALEEGVVHVWKVGTSFSSFFYAGVPPRQGSSGSEPFKSISFNVGDEATGMGVEEALTGICFEWTAERSVRLKIREVILTFNT